ncbi:MAG: hypothetical protein ACI9BW_000969 [Gammaproteobacteria bacterium]|jgi:hypothetical protein
MGIRDFTDYARHHVAALTRANKCILLALLSVTCATELVYATDVYQEPSAFLAESFDNEVPEGERLWITKPIQDEIRKILGHELGQLRVRYWQRGERTAWILEEIGKERPITTGLIVDGNQLTNLRVLIYRESRGWEVRYPAFTDQFNGATLTEDYALDRHIDGISGATMSVNALTRLAQLALLLHRHANT